MKAAEQDKTTSDKAFSYTGHRKQKRLSRISQRQMTAVLLFWWVGDESMYWYDTLTISYL